MPALHIRDVPPETVAALKERAARHGRSMQQELREVLDRAAVEPVVRRRRGPLRLTTVTTGISEPWSRDEIYDDDGR